MFEQIHQPNQERVNIKPPKPESTPNKIEECDEDEEGIEDPL